MREIENPQNHANIDVLCSSILGALSKIESLITDPNNKSVFELQSDASTDRALNELSSLQRSLEQYAGRSQTLSYYGFLGHFSAGKTTTINSILDSDDPRPTGHNPTDTAITIIAHENNVANLIGTHRRGDLAVGTSLRANQLLSNTVIVDTPGSGDPTIVEEMVRDFLPICDTLIYVLSATSPLDNSDIPTLKKSLHELPFIPIKFVVTRADEFKKDLQKVFSSENYHTEKANLFRTELARRLQSTLPGIVVSPEDILLIDNISQFNIDKLKSFIFENDSAKSNRAMELHSHKISYFSSSTDRIRKFFVAYVDSRISALGSFLDEAKASHKRYLNVETMASSNLTESWQLSRNHLDQRQVSEEEMIEDWDICSDLPLELRNVGQLSVFIQDTNKSINDSAERAAQNICRETKKILLREHDSHISQLRHRLIQLTDSDYPAFSSSSLSELAKEELFDFEVTIPSSLRYRFLELPSEFETVVSKSLNTLSNSCKRLDDWLSTGHSISTSRETIDQSIEQLRTMLEGFFDSVQVYRSAILAMNARKTAQEAGIVDAIENLERTEITPTQRAQWLGIVTERIFPNWKVSISTLETSLKHLHENLKSIEKELKDIRKTPVQVKPIINSEDIPSLDWVKNSPPVIELLESAVNDYHSTSEKLFSNLNNQQVECLTEEREKMIADKRIIREDRKKKFQKYLILPIIIFFLGTALYYLWQKQQPTNWAAPIIINIIWWLLITLFTKVWDKAKDEIAKREQQYYRTAAEVAEDLLNQVGTKLDLNFIDSKQVEIKNKIAQHLNESFESLISKYAINPFMVKYTGIREISRKLDELSIKYLESIKTLTLSLSEFYSNTGVNLSALNEVSNAIRAEAIEPSFAMLQERDTKLKEIRTKLAELEIMEKSK